MTNSILDVIRNNPDKSRKLLQHDNSDRLTAAIVDSQFHYIFSDHGSNKRASEEAIASQGALTSVYNKLPLSGMFCVFCRPFLIRPRNAQSVSGRSGTEITKSLRACSEI